MPPVVFTVCCRDTTMQQEDNSYLSLLIFLDHQCGVFSLEKDQFLYCNSALKHPQDREANLLEACWEPILAECRKLHLLQAGFLMLSSCLFLEISQA